MSPLVPCPPVVAEADKVALAAARLCFFFSALRAFFWDILIWGLIARSLASMASSAALGEALVVVVVAFEDGAASLASPISSSVSSLDMLPETEVFVTPVLAVVLECLDDGVLDVVVDSSC